MISSNLPSRLETRLRRTQVSIAGCAIAGYAFAAGRLAEYGLPVEFDVSEFALARGLSAAEKKTLDEFVEANRSGIAGDLDDDPVYLAQPVLPRHTRERAPGVVFTDVKDVKASK
jgi:peptide subunit release factor RF-3